MKFLRVNFAHAWCICEDKEEVEIMTEGYEPNEYTVEEVEMTAAEFEALPEFEG